MGIHTRQYTRAGRRDAMRGCSEMQSKCHKSTPGAALGSFFCSPSIIPDGVEGY